MLCDVVVAGAGPAGALTATLLARAGARVQMFDRARFPRAKLCGDTLNPGAMRLLRQHTDVRVIEQRAFALDGMILTGSSVAVHGTYPHALRGQAIVRRELDQLLLQDALDAGVQFEEGVVVAAPLGSESRVHGVVLKMRSGHRRECRAPLVIAADGRESRLARACGLARYAARPRRWAIGGYFDGVQQLTTKGEMHVRSTHYIGVAPLPGGLANACLVVPHDAAGVTWRDPASTLTDAIRSDPRLRDRFAAARLIDAPHTLGPMAVDVRAPGLPGMLFAGDAAGFIDPITGDGLHFALAGACLAADVALSVIRGATPSGDAPALLARRRYERFAPKWRFNRAIRSVVGSRAAVEAAGLAARLSPRVFERVIAYAGDC